MTKKQVENLSPHDLETLGAERLSELLLEAARRDAAVAARLQRELAAGGPEGKLVNLVRSQLRGLASHEFVTWHEARDMADDIDALREDIVGKVLSKNPQAAAELLGEVIAAEERIFGAVDDSNGEVGGALQRVVHAWGGAWAKVADVDPDAVADLVLKASEGNDYGTRESLVDAFAKALGPNGLDRLEQLARAKLSDRPQRKKGRAGGWDYERIRLVQVLRDVADLKGDPDLFVEATRLGGAVAPYSVEIARRMLDADRPDEAFRWVADADECDLHDGLEVAEIKSAALEALGQMDDAQTVRWRRIETCLDPDVLDAYLERLKSARARAKARSNVRRIATGHEDPHLGLWFLTEHGDPKTICEFVAQRIDELDGARYELLRPAAEALVKDEPAAAARLRRRMVESVLDRGRSTAYAYAARDLQQAATAARRVGSSASLEHHEAWVERLRAQHGRRRSFWSRVDAIGRR